MENRYYAEVLDVTKLLKQKEQTVAVTMFLLSALFTVVHYVWLPHRVFYLLPVVFFSLAVVLVMKRDQDVKLGGISSYALLVYYALDNAWVLAHFWVLVVIGLPLVIFIVRRGFIGPLALYMLAILLLPISAVSYAYLGDNFQFKLVETATTSAEEVIYIFLPLIYIHTSLSVKKKQFIKESAYFFMLLLFGVIFWVAIDRLFNTVILA